MDNNYNYDGNIYEQYYSSDLKVNPKGLTEHRLTERNIQRMNEHKMNEQRIHDQRVTEISDSEDNTNKHSFKQDYECIYQYSEYDMEMDLLNTYSSLYMYHMHTIKDINTIDKIEKKYLKIKNNKEVILTDDIKELIKNIDIEISNYRLLLNKEVTNKKSALNNFRYGFGIGVGVSVIGFCMYIYKGNT